MAIKLFGNDNGTVRQVKKLFGNDNGTVRQVKKLFALDGSTVRLIYQSAISFLVDGTAKTFTAGTKEVVEFGVDTDFDAGPNVTAGQYIEFQFGGTPSTNFVTSTSGTYFLYLLGESYTISQSSTSSTITNATQLAAYIQATAAADSDLDHFTITNSGGNVRFTLDSGESQFADVSTIAGFLSLDGTGSLVNMTLKVNLNGTTSTNTHTNTFSTTGISRTGWNGISDTTLYGVISPASYSISNTSESIPAITGTFAADANATTARNALKTALNADTEFSNAFESATDLSVAAVAGAWNCKIDAWPTSTDTSIFVNLPGLGFTTVTITSGASIEDVIDAIIADTDWDTSTYSMTKVGTDTIRVANSSGSMPLASDTGSLTGFGISSLSGTAGSLTITLTDNNDSTVTASVTDSTATFYTALLGPPQFSVDRSGSNAQVAVRYTAKSAADFDEFTYSITQNSGSETEPYLNVSTEGTDGTAATAVSVTYTKDGTETTTMTSLSSGAATDTIGSEVATALGDNASYTASTDTLTFADDVSDVSITVTNNNSSDTVSFTEQ